MRRALARLLAVIGAVAVGGAVGGGIYLASVIRSGFSTRQAPSAFEARVARTMRSLSVPARAKKLKNPLTVTPEVLADAREHWARECALCHGNDGMGDTDLGASFYPRAPNMLTEETQELSDGELYYAIQNGIRLSAMPAWGKAGQDEARTWALVAFIRELPNLSSDDIEAMKKLNPK